MEDTVGATHTAALEAWDAGLCPVRARADGTKAPEGRWKDYQTTRPTRAEVDEWFRDGHPGLGIICGTVSNNFEMLEIEGRFVAEHGIQALIDAMVAADLLDLYFRLTDATVTTPSGGRHFNYRVDGPVGGNTKIARRPATAEELAANPQDRVKTLIETRGEGGFIVTAPSHGPVHPSGKPWMAVEGWAKRIPNITLAEREAMFEALRVFDVPIEVRHPIVLEPTHRARLRTFNGTEVHASWMDDVEAHLAATSPMPDLLAGYGWQHAYNDAHGRQLWTRPGKEHGVSASINGNGRLHPFSTSVPFDVNGHTTYNELDVIAAYEHGGDRQAAGRAVAEATGILKAWQQARDQVKPPNPQPRPNPPPGVDPSTGEILHPVRNEEAEPVEPLVDPSFEPIDLDPVLDGNYAQPDPVVLQRNDGQALFYLEQINGIHGDSGTGKGWVACEGIAQQIMRGHDVMLIDLEDVAPSIVARLRQLGATDQAIRDHFVYIRPTSSFSVFAVDRLVEIVENRKVTLVVIDSLGEAFGLDGIDENSDAEVGPWLRRVARRLADAGAAVVLVDHSTKANDNPLHPSGSKRKRAAIGGASYYVTAPRPLVAGKGGKLRLTCAKDRHGSYARGEHVADFVMADGPAGRMTVYPGGPTDEATPPIELACRAAVKAAEEAGEPLSQNGLVASMRSFKGATDLKREGVKRAVERGLLVEKSEGQTKRYHLVVRGV
jgi:KaiC/GvpD/RAD55 family RecA-like ATPase